MAKYTYTIFDADPQSSSGTAWDTHTKVEIEADTSYAALEIACDVAERESVHGEYEPGDRIWALVWDADGVLVETGATLTILGEKP